MRLGEGFSSTSVRQTRSHRDPKRRADFAEFRALWSVFEKELMALRVELMHPHADRHHRRTQRKVRPRKLQIMISKNHRPSDGGLACDAVVLPILGTVSREWGNLNDVVGYGNF